MEWRSDTDRHLVISPANVPIIGAVFTRGKGWQHGSPPERPSDVSGLAASLVRQALPCHFHIICNANDRGSHLGGKVPS